MFQPQLTSVVPVFQRPRAVVVPLLSGIGALRPTVGVPAVLLSGALRFSRVLQRLPDAGCRQNIAIVRDSEGVDWICWDDICRQQSTCLQLGASGVVV